jgi:ribosomal protein S21
MEKAYKVNIMSKNRPVNVEVKLRHPKDDSNKLIRKFIKKVKKEKILEEVRNRRYYEKPASKRRKAKIKKIENARKAQAERDKKTRLQSK